MIFVFDENTSLNLVSFMQQMGASNILHLNELYERGTLDTNFLPALAEQGKVLVTSDVAMRKAHKSIMETHKVKALFLPKEYSASWLLWDQAVFLFRYWPTIAKEAEKLRDLSVKLISINGRLNDF